MRLPGPARLIIEPRSVGVELVPIAAYPKRQYGNSNACSVGQHRHLGILIRVANIGGIDPAMHIVWSNDIAPAKALYASSDDQQRTGLQTFHQRIVTCGTGTQIHPLGRA
jgi:hypothetical protein